MRVHYLQHEEHEGLGSMEAWFRTHAKSLTSTRLFAGETLPALGSFDWLVVMGGGMSVNDEATLSWMRPEKELVRAAIRANLRVLGICLGAQMIASALGARVYRNQLKEIGWWPIERLAEAEKHPLGALLPARAEVFHWHGETFDLPPGSEWLARSQACAHQAFAIGRRVLGLQFHLETTLASARSFVAGAAGDLAPAPYVQAPAAMLERPERFDELNRTMGSILQAMAS